MLGWSHCPPSALVHCGCPLLPLAPLPRHALSRQLSELGRGSSKGHWSRGVRAVKSHPRPAPPDLTVAARALPELHRLSHLQLPHGSPGNPPQEQPLATDHLAYKYPNSLALEYNSLKVRAGLEVPRVPAAMAACLEMRPWLPLSSLSLLSTPKLVPETVSQTSSVGLDSSTQGLLLGSPNQDTGFECGVGH